MTDHSEKRMVVVRKLPLLVFVAILIFAATTIVRAGGARRAFPGRPDNNRGDKSELKGQGDNDRDNHDEDSRGGYAIGLWGDLPYSDTQALVGVPNVIADMNSQDLAFTAHDGD